MKVFGQILSVQFSLPLCPSVSWHALINDSSMPHILWCVYVNFLYILICFYQTKQSSLYNYCHVLAFWASEEFKRQNDAGQHIWGKDIINVKPVSHFNFACRENSLMWSLWVILILHREKMQPHKFPESPLPTWSLGLNILVKKTWVHYNSIVGIKKKRDTWCATYETFEEGSLRKTFLYSYVYGYDKYVRHCPVLMKACHDMSWEGPQYLAKYSWTFLLGYSFGPYHSSFHVFYRIYLLCIILFLNQHWK